MSKFEAEMQEKDRKWREAREARERRADRRFAAIGLAAILAVLFGGFLLVACRTGSAHEDGYSVGTLINVRQEGVLWSRPAAALLHTGENKGDEYALDPHLFEQARHLADRSARVRVEYSNRYVCWAWNYADCSVITKIEEAPADAPGGDRD